MAVTQQKRVTLWIFLLVFCTGAASASKGGRGGRVRHGAAPPANGKQAAQKYLLGHGIGGGGVDGTLSRQYGENVGLWPSVFNISTKALISANATCGEGGREEFCRMSEGSRGRCGVCNNFSYDPGKRHSIHYAIDSSNRWWQSPSLFYGPEYEYVTIVVDLKQVYHVAYVIIKAANSPRPGAWILEKSLDGENFLAWQFFARNEKECLERYGIVATKGRPRYVLDSEVICTSDYSRLTPMENGEIHISLVHGRPGSNETSPELLEFTKARFVRLRLQGFRASVEPIPRWLSQDAQKDKRLFYSVRDITIGGQCVCNGHAASCRHNVASGNPTCECTHHTCGLNCDRCCPMYHQRKWGAGSSRDSRECLPCNCHGHSSSCHYEESVDRTGLSFDINGIRQGGGVCDNCTAHTTGINCERCIKGYYRPLGVKPDAEVPCLRCECDPIGSSGSCEQEGENAGSCRCKEGFAGALCDQCAQGYRGFPNCEICPCDSKGIVPHNDCEEDCTCKAFADGKNCGYCKPGHFALRHDNPEGCSSCFCSGVTNLCESAVVTHHTLHFKDDWKICDISISQIVQPTWDSDLNSWLIGNFEIPDVESFYWLAPKEYLGNKLETYNSHITFKVHWIVMRGDTSGKPTLGPNIILVGNNGMKIAHGDEEYGGSNATFHVRLKESGWYHVPSQVKDIITRLRRTEYKGDPVSRFQFMSVLTDIKYVLFRAMFHTDQIEGMLESVIMNSGELNEEETYGSVEKCSCPSGYTGLSCESCDYGYVKIVTNMSTHQEQGFCVKCDCNGHSNTCDPDTGQCFCEHNTTGEKCERCNAGYYGNPLTGTPFDCKKCACPLSEEQNNFSPSCQLDFFSELEENSNGYVCTQCPKGYTGDHCELCDDGYFGNPMELYSQCEPCSCAGGRCNRTTGQCLGCPGNTEGWKCEKCKPGHFGDPQLGGCQSCSCDQFGSVSSDCDNVTGQCLCKEHFVDQSCDRCEEGYGNVTAFCTKCSCNEIGSQTDVCDSQTGICECKLGVEGFHCDACQHLHYGFSESGCQSCNCNPRGSEIATCDITTGQCRCRPFYVGRTCDKCQVGYWENGDNDGCIRCDCNFEGSNGAQLCDQKTGQCVCKEGVGGIACDSCLLGYYGFSEAGCRQCEPCSKMGHVCDKETGKCVCPPNSRGEYCHLCTSNAWKYEANKGCKLCNCSRSGSLSMHCNQNSGECNCRQGFTGSNCDRCSHGYFGYPRCRRCNCDYSGTDKYKANCDKNGICQCGNDGLCPCKSNVSGRKCDRCRSGTFGLHIENPDGCTQCFCFGRSSKCTESGLTWSQIRVNSSRTLVVVPNSEIRSINDYDYSNGPIRDVESFEKLLVIPDVHGNMTIHRNRFESPLYWKLHHVFSGDRILSYGGYLSFISNTVNSRQRLSQDTINHHPLVQLRGQGKIILEYYPPLPTTSNRHEVRLHESLWKRIYPKDTNLSPRELFMITLQNVQHVFIKATDSADFDALYLQDVMLDTGILVPGHPPPLARGVEICDCPHEYNSSSCQNPSVGFFRDYKPHPSINGTILIDTFVGTSKPCECNGRSKVCDIETGHCLNCQAYTDGKSCERCSDGYYGNPMIPFGSCQPCPCPWPHQNFAKECVPTDEEGSEQFICRCRDGYAGLKCDKCSFGYYGQPQLPGGRCRPCECNVEGKLGDGCDPETGQCVCKPGLTGRQCSQCEKPRHVLQKYQCTPCDECTQLLLDDLDDLSGDLHRYTDFLLNGTIEPPWKKFNDLKNRQERLNNTLQTYLKNKASAEKVLTDEHLNGLENRLNLIQEDLNKNDHESIFKNGKTVLRDVDELIERVKNSKERLKNLIDTLKNFGKSQLSTREAVAQAKELMRQISAIDKSLQLTHGDIFDRCSKVKELAEEMLTKANQLNPQEARTKLNDIKRRLDDLEIIAMEVELRTDETELKNRKNKIGIAKLAEKIDEINEKNRHAEDNLQETNEIIAKTSKTLNDTGELFEKWSNDSDFGILLEKLKIRTNQLSEIDTDEYLTSVLEHVRQLETNASEFEKLFNLTSKEIDAIKASEAYANIKKFIEEAEKSAIQALAEVNAALDTLSPEGKDSIETNTTISLADSGRLKIRIENQKDILDGILQRKEELVRKISKLDGGTWSNGMENRKQDTIIRDIKEEINKFNREKIENVIKDTINQTDGIKNIYRSVINLVVLEQTEIQKPFQHLQDLLTTEKINELRQQIELTKVTLENVLKRNQTYLDVIKENTKKFEDFKAQNGTISKRLEELRAKIENAKKTADRIRISLTGSSCMRSYLLKHLSPTLSTKLAVAFNYTALSGEVVSSLFKLVTSTGQFINMTISSDILTFEWKLGETINQLKYKDALTLHTFYAIEVERIGGKVNMTVNKESFLGLSKSSNETAIFEAHPKNLIQIGPGIPGCLRDVEYDGFKVGLWNFLNTEGVCAGCIRSNDLTLENAYDFYQGDGYSEIPKEEPELNYVKPGEFYLQFSLKTFDENALLFLAPDPERKNYIAVSLNDGRVQFKVHYPNHKEIVLTTKEKYNTGEKIRVSATKFWTRETGDTAVLKINEETALMETRAEIDRSALLRLKKINYYFGGVPPDYFLMSQKATEDLHTHDSLLGGLYELNVCQLFSDDSVKKFGVGRLSGEIEFRQAWFEGRGYVKMREQPVKHKIFFLIKSKESDCFLMLINNNTLVTLSNGRINVGFVSDGSGKRTLKSTIPVNDDHSHLVEINHYETDFQYISTTLKLNGLKQASDLSAINQEDYKTDEIFIGGGDGTIQNLLRNHRFYTGIISDITVDDELIKFNKRTLESFEKVKIGRNGPKRQVRILTTTTTETKMFEITTETDVTPSNIKEMQNTESCGNPVNYTFDPDAAKFGDKQNSHVIHYMKDNFWRRDYTFEISFRTCQPDGVLFLSYGLRQHFNLLEIRNGKLNFRANAKKLKEVSLPQRLDDGNWYTIKIETIGLKKKRKLTIALNGFKTKPVRPPRNKVSRELYIGGVPENVTTVPVMIRSTLRPFRGCIKNLKINKKSQFLVRDKNTIHHNIGQCFPNIERGSYFGGDAYAVYNQYFQIEQLLEVSLQFRTSEQNGILLSVSNPRNSPALAVELQNGAIVMTTDNGYGTVTNVTNNLSDFALCNNQWHNVTAVYTNSEIAINVDGIRKIWVLPDEDTLMDELEAPLYIGGIPDYAPVGTLRMKENFKGCIRNVKFGEREVNWSDMEKLSNILLDSCPTNQ